MRGKFTIVWAFGVLSLVAPCASPKEELSPFLALRPYFYAERGLLSPLANEREVVEASAPKLPLQLLIDFKEIFTRPENLVIVGVGLGAAGAASYLDETIVESGLNEQVNEGSALDATFEAGAVLGSAAVHFGAAFAAYGVGKLASKPGVEAVGRDLVRAQIVTQTLTAALKRAVGRERPDGSNNRSFPSGHSSATFATATVLQRHYGWDIGIPAYIVASYVATSRLNEARHYLSDVVFGATIGMLVGRSVTLDLANNHFAVSPMVVPEGVGVQLMWLGPGGK